jgi:hypothetical protein
MGEILHSRDIEDMTDVKIDEDAYPSKTSVHRIQSQTARPTFEQLLG